MSVRHAVPQDTPFLTVPIGRRFLSIPLAVAAVRATRRCGSANLPQPATAMAPGAIAGTSEGKNP